MNDLIRASLAHAAALDAARTAREAAADARSAAEGAHDELVRVALASDDAEVAEAARAVDHCRTRIADLIEGTDGMREKVRLVKEAAAAMRTAARSGDAQVAEADLAAAEEALAETRAEIRDLRRALAGADRVLLRLAKAVA